MGLKNLLFLLFIPLTLSFPMDWTTLRGSVDRKGYIPGNLRPPFRLLWTRHFKGERISTCVEPIVAQGKLFVATNNGNLYTLDAQTGKPIWRFKAHAAFLHSPAFSDGLVIAGNTDGFLYALDWETGSLRWQVNGGRGGFSASPTIADGKVFIGSRSGKFLAVELSSGKILWQKDIGVPIRQTASFSNNRVFVTAEDMRVRCWDANSGELLWISEPLMGQTAKDYYPIIAEADGKELVLIRTNPVVNMGKLLAQDRGLICKNAGIDDSDWRNIDAWVKSERAKGNEELWYKEQDAIIEYLRDNPYARTFFVLDAKTGEEVKIPPVLWTGGCQGVGNLPVVLPHGKLIVMFRTAYGNWTLGVAPLVALGILDPSKNRITPLFHNQGNQPPWNTFWGTADESQNFLLIDDTLLIIHQGTLSGFNLNTKDLFPIWGERDSWGGFRNLPWARNEWHGPSRGSVAVTDNRIYLQVGSRILCIATGEEGQPGEDFEIDGDSLPTHYAPPLPQSSLSQLKELLIKAVDEFLSSRWLPLYVEPGLAGKEFIFNNSGDVFYALSLAYPHLTGELQKRIKDFLAKEWEEYPPFSLSSYYPLKEGKAREYSPIPIPLRESQQEVGPHPFGNIYSIWLYAQFCDEWQRIKENWEDIKASFADFKNSGWSLDEAKGDLWANRYLASLISFRKMGEKLGDLEAVEEAKKVERTLISSLTRWWQRCARELELPIFRNINEWDAFIGKGDSLFFSIRPHKAKVALFQDLTPEVAEFVKERARPDFEKIWQTFQLLCPTWHLQGEERQVHYGENYLDPPDFSLSAFKALAWLKSATGEELSKKIDIPFCRADLYFITKLAITIEHFSH